MNQYISEYALHVGSMMDRGVRQNRGMASLVEAGVVPRMMAAMVAGEGAVGRRRAIDRNRRPLGADQGIERCGVSWRNADATVRGGMAEGAELVCKVVKTKCPVKAA